MDKDPLVLDKEGDTSSALSWSPIGDLLAVAMESTIRIWDPDCPENAIFNLPIPPDESVTSLTWDPMGTLVVGGTGNGELLVWNLDNLDADPFVLDAHEAKVNAVSFDPGYRHLVSAGEDGLVRLWDLRDPSGRSRVFSAGEARSLAWHPSDGFLVGYVCICC